MFVHVLLNFVLMISKAHNIRIYIALFFSSNFKMVSSSRLFVGCRVTGCFGPFIEDPDSTRKRRTRERVTGTIIRAADKHKWDVIFDFDGKLKKGISSRSLMIASAGEGIPLASTGIEEQINEVRT